MSGTNTSLTTPNLNKSLNIVYNIIESGIATRRSIFSDSVGSMISTSYDKQEIGLNPGEEIQLQGITSFLFIKTNAPIQLQVNATPFFSVNSLFVATAPFSNVIMFNASTSPVYALVISF